MLKQLSELLFSKDTNKEVNMEATALQTNTPQPTFSPPPLEKSFAEDFGGEFAEPTISQQLEKSFSEESVKEPLESKSSGSNFWSYVMFLSVSVSVGYYGYKYYLKRMKKKNVKKNIKEYVKDNVNGSRITDNDYKI